MSDDYYKTEIIEVRTTFEIKWAATHIEAKQDAISCALELPLSAVGAGNNGGYEVKRLLSAVVVNGGGE